MRRIGTKGWIALGGALLVLALSAAAFGYFTASGSGSGTASVDEADPVSFEATAPTASLYPGTSADVAVKITNPNPFRVHVPSLVLDTGMGTSGFDVDGAHAGCDVSALSFAPQDNAAAGWFVPGTDDAPAELSLDLANAVSLDTSAENECQGATFTVYLAVGT
jgi:hypothetical protein